MVQCTSRYDPEKSAAEQCLGNGKWELGGGLYYRLSRWGSKSTPLSCNPLAMASSAIITTGSCDVVVSDLATTVRWHSVDTYMQLHSLT